MGYKDSLASATLVEHFQYAEHLSKPFFHFYYTSILFLHSLWNQIVKSPFEIYTSVIYHLYAHPHLPFH